MNGGGLPYVGRSLLRREDRRLLTGQGGVVADLVAGRAPAIDIAPFDPGRFR